MKKKLLVLSLLLIFLGQLMSFSEPLEIESDLNGELLLNYEKNIRKVDGKLWILYYDAALYPLTSYLKIAREQDDGSFEISILSTMWIDISAKRMLDCTFVVQDEDVTILYQKTNFNITDVRVYKIHSDDLLATHHENEFSSQYNNIVDMSLELADNEQILVLLRGQLYNNCDMQCLYYEYRNGKEFTGSDYFDGPVYSKDDIYIRQTAGGTNQGWPTFNGFVVSEHRIMDASTGQPAVNSAPMDLIFREGYIENSGCINMSAGVAAAIRANGYILANSMDRDICYAKIDGGSATCRYGDIVTERDTFTVYNSFPDLTHPNFPVGDSIWTNYIDVQTIDWDEGTFTVSINNGSVFCYCQLWIEGNVSGRMTWGCADTIYITNDLTYQSITPGDPPDEGVCGDMLGLVSEESIMIKYKNYDPWLETINTDNCDDIYIYGVLAALGEPLTGNGWDDWTAGNLGVEFLHPHGSTPEYEITVPGGGRELYPYPDLNKFVYSDVQYYSGDPGFIMHSNDIPAGYPCCGYPYEDQNYGNGITPPYGADYPLYNPVYPESSDDIVFDRGTIHFYGALYERGFHDIRCSGVAGSPQHPSMEWLPELNEFGGPHAACGYEMDMHYDERLNYQNMYPPEIYLLIESPPEHRVTILHSTNGGNTFVQRYDQLREDIGIISRQKLQTVEEEGIIKFLYTTNAAYELANWNTNSFCFSRQTLSYDDFSGNIRLMRIYDGDLYFKDDEHIFQLENIYFYPMASLIMNDYYGFYYKYNDRLMWEAEWQSNDLEFTFYEGDQNWQFTEIGESVLEHGSGIDQNNLVEFYLNCTEEGEGQLFLHVNEYGQDGLFLARGIIEGLPLDNPDEIPGMLSLLSYPNPIYTNCNRNETITIEYNIGAGNTGSLKLFNIRGQCLQEWQLSGRDELQCSTAKLSSGIYLLELETSGQHLERKLSVVK